MSTELEQTSRRGRVLLPLRFNVPVVVAAWGEMARSVPTLAERRPTLLVRATQAHVCSDGLVAALRQELGGALFETDLECGHMLYWERFEETGTLVRDFLSAEVPGLGTT
ncbi:MAG: hypothetical protein R2705_12610 [Ilumatobacteraceae bacterium]